MIIGFIIGLFAGVVIMCILTISASAERNEHNKEVIGEIEENQECFTYDCLKDEDENDKDIPKII